MIVEFAKKFTPRRYLLSLLLVIILVACSPAGPTQPTFVPTLPPTRTSPATVAPPSPTNTKIAPPTSTATPTEIPPTTVSPTVLPTRPISSSSAAYVCPWLEHAQTTPVYTFQVVNSYPHDPGAYTQGLIYRDGVLYEGTGLYGQSSLRKVALESGAIEKMIELPQQFFGEGITELAGKIYQLTWREQTGFVYDAASFDQLQTFPYPTEGWGLTHDGKTLIMSDGSPNLYFLDPETLQIVGKVVVTAENLPVPRLNELEYVEGEVWANVYQTSCIARIDPSSGQVLGWIDISTILPAQDVPGSEVPNGIAYDEEGKKIFVTGKLWPKLFEIEVKSVDQKE
jgi:glutaminyl-peptide cyclotransferase